jgi:nucleotidyltransferase/DNA polymerase involved in DNA repair
MLTLVRDALGWERAIAFIEGLPKDVRELPMVGPKLAARLQAAGVRTIGQGLDELGPLTFDRAVDKDARRWSDRRSSGRVCAEIGSGAVPERAGVRA